jgi:hypothetical protein
MIDADTQNPQTSLHLCQSINFQIPPSHMITSDLHEACQHLAIDPANEWCNLR